MQKEGIRGFFCIRLIAAVLAAAVLMSATSASAGCLQASTGQKQEPGGRDARSAAPPSLSIDDTASDKPVAIAGKPTSATMAKKKFPWLLVAGAAVVVGVVAAVLLANKSKTDEANKPGSISVSSTPSGAKIFLDGADKGLTTPSTLSGVTPGKHSLKLALEGYKDYLQDVTAKANETVSVTATLVPHAISVTSPASAAGWLKGNAYDIQWTADAGLLRSAKAMEAAKGEFASPPPREERERDVQTASITVVNIDLYKAGAKVLSIASNSPNDSIERWTVPSGQVLGTDYRIRISSSSVPEIYGESGVFSITSPLGEISVSSEPDHATVKLNGTETGRFTNCVLTDLSPGTYTLRLDLDVYGKWEGQVQVQAGQRTNVSVNLSPYPYVFDRKWGSYGFGDGQFRRVGFIAVDPSCNSYVTDRTLYRITQFSPTGTFLWQISETSDPLGIHMGPQGVASDAGGWMYVVDDNRSKIVKFKPGVSMRDVNVSSWGMNFPRGIALSLAGDIYVIDAGNSRIIHADPSFTVLGTFGSSGSGPGQFEGSPSGITVDLTGNVYVGGQYRVQKFTANGVFINQWGSAGSGPGQFNGVSGIAWHRSGVIYVSDSGNHRIQKFSDAGTYITQWGSLGGGDGQFNQPSGVAVDNWEFVYVADAGNYRIQKFYKNTATGPTVKITSEPIRD